MHRRPLAIATLLAAASLGQGCGSTMASSGSSSSSTSAAAQSAAGGSGAQSAGNTGSSAGMTGSTGSLGTVGTLGGMSASNGQSASGNSASSGSTSGSTGDTGDSGDTGDTYDFPCGSNPPCLLTQQCCLQPSGSGNALTCVDSCPNADDVVSCDGPDECNPSAPYCCGTEVLAGGSGANCNVSSLDTLCKATCPTQFASGCTGTDQVILCHESADCPDPNNPKCCEFTQNGATLDFCASDTVALFANQCFQ